MNEIPVEWNTLQRELMEDTERSVKNIILSAGKCLKGNPIDSLFEGWKRLSEPCASTFKDFTTMKDILKTICEQTAELITLPQQNPTLETHRHRERLSRLHIVLLDMLQLFEVSRIGCRIKPCPCTKCGQAKALVCKPCGHVIMCSKCLWNRDAEARGECPVCARKIEYTESQGLRDYVGIVPQNLKRKRVHCT
jgi:hypothetical protein